MYRNQSIFVLIVALAMLGLATPAAADISLKPQLLGSLEGRTLDSRGLVNLFRENGVLNVEIERSTSSAVNVTPTITILSDREGQLSNLAGNATRLSAGRHPFTSIALRELTRLEQELARLPGDQFVPEEHFFPGDMFSGNQFDVLSVEVLDSGEEVRLGDAGGALVIEFTGATPSRERIDNSKLVVFLRTPNCC